MSSDLKASDAVWIATALLQRQSPTESFTVSEIVDRVFVERLTERPRSTVYLHVNQHCVANRPPNAAALKMLVEVTDNRRRLYHEGDFVHPKRLHARVLPESSLVPQEHKPLLAWYREWFLPADSAWEETDPLMRLFGSGKEIWAEEHADEYVKRLRDDWE